MGNCNITLGNKGISGCEPVAAVARKLLLSSYFDGDGNINKLTGLAALKAADGLNKAYFDALINNVDPLKRIYPSAPLDNVIDERAESIKETFDSGEEVIVQQGPRTFASVMAKRTAASLKKYTDERCLAIGAYIVGLDGGLTGSQIIADELQLIRISNETWDPILVKTTNSTVEKIALNFTWHTNEKDTTLKTITSDELSADVSLLDLKGLLDILGTFSAIIVTGFTVDIFDCYGTAITPNPIEGLVIGDMTLFNETDQLAVALVTFDPVVGTPGRYTVTFAAQTPADILKLNTTKAGLDSAQGIGLVEILMP